MKELNQLENEYYHSQKGNGKMKVPPEWEQRINATWTIMLLGFIYFVGSFLWHLMF